MLPEIATYLAAHGCGTVGTDLILGELPDAPEDCVALLEVGGLPPRRVFGGVGWEQDRIQALVRGATYADARERAETVYRTLRGITNAVLSGTLYLRADPTPPALVERDQHERPIFAISIRIDKALSVLGD